MTCKGSYLEYFPISKFYTLCNEGVVDKSIFPFQLSLHKASYKPELPLLKTIVIAFHLSSVHWKLTLTVLQYMTLAVKLLDAGGTTAPYLNLRQVITQRIQPQ